eukprot:6301473-Pyramimonas_sp.AAC.1
MRKHNGTRGKLDMTMRKLDKTRATQAQGSKAVGAQKSEDVRRCGLLFFTVATLRRQVRTSSMH